jgi:hypothetical protein
MQSTRWTSGCPRRPRRQLGAAFRAKLHVVQGLSPLKEIVNFVVHSWFLSLGGIFAHLTIFGAGSLPKAV